MTDFSNKTTYPIASPPPSDGRILGSTSGYLARDFAVADFLRNLGGGIFGCSGPVVRINDNFAGLQLGNNGTAANNAHIALQSGDIVFFNGNYGAGTERVRIKQDGKVGIGTGNPSLKLHIAGDSVANNLLGIFDSGSGGKSWGIGPSVGTGDRTTFGLYNYSDSRALFLANDSIWQFYGGGGALRFNIDASTIRPGSDNTHSAGGASHRFTVVYAATGTINTSDEREKAWIGGLTDAHLRAARRIEDELGFYQWLAEVERKGEDGARLHFGARAQRVIQIFIDEGLEGDQSIDLPGDAHVPERERPSFRHAFLCLDTWEDEFEDEYETVRRRVRVPVEEESEAILGPDAKPARRKRTRFETVEERVPTGRKIKVRPAGNRFGFRTDQLALFMIAAQAAMRRALEDRITALEADRG